METTYYTLYARQADVGGVARASGGEDRLVLFTRRPTPKKPVWREDNVISLSDYRSRLAAEEESGEPEPPEDGEGPAEPRARTDHSTDRLRALELAACVAMICVAAVACVALLL